MTDFDIVPAHIEHCAALAENLRPADRLEVAASGMEAQAFIEECVRRSTLAWTAFFDGEIAAIGGVGDHGVLTDRTGVPWLLTTPAVERNVKRFVYWTRIFSDRIQAAYPRLENCVDARYAAAIRWLKHLGFTIGDEVTIGPCRVTFLAFSRGRA